jgi:hypothetical protein
MKNATTLRMRLTRGGWGSPVATDVVPQAERPALASGSSGGYETFIPGALRATLTARIVDRRSRRRLCSAVARPKEFRVTAFRAYTWEFKAIAVGFSETGMVVLKMVGMVAMR